MSLHPLPLRRLRAATLTRREPRLERLRVRLADGARATLHVASYDRDAYVPRIVVLDRPTPLVRWCREHGIEHAVVGGFFLRRPSYIPLGQLRMGGRPVPSMPFDPPWDAIRACVHINRGGLRIASRKLLGPDPDGDLLQAGPMLVVDGRSVVADGADPEGFSEGAHQFDSDITLGRYPRAGLATAGRHVLAVACDGRTHRDAGMTLAELADALIGLGATDALNLDGGGSASLVHGGLLRNRPREQHGADLLEGRQVITAIAFEAR